MSTASHSAKRNRYNDYALLFLPASVQVYHCADVARSCGPTRRGAADRPPRLTPGSLSARPVEELLGAFRTDRAVSTMEGNT